MIKHTKKEMLFHLHLMRVHLRILTLMVTRGVTSRVVRILQH